MQYCDVRLRLDALKIVSGLGLNQGLPAFTAFLKTYSNNYYQTSIVIIF